MYRESKYNYTIKAGNKYIVYNSLSGKIAKGEIPISKDIKNKETQEKLIEQKFLVLDKEDEKDISLRKFYRYRYDPKLNAVLVVTKKCNFRCKYCYEEHDEEQTVIFSHFTRFLQKHLKDYTKLQISWFGGEPMLCYKKIIEYSKKWQDLSRRMLKPYQASMTTNGYLLSVDRFMELLDVGVMSYQITLDGLSETHDQQRYLAGGQGTFEVILKNLRDIRDHIKRHFEITIRVNVSAPILEQLDQVINFLWDEFGKDSRFNFYFTLVKNWGGNCKESMKDELLSGEDESRMFEKMLKHDRILNYSSYYGMLMNGMCFASQENSMVVEPDAKLRKCTVLEGKENLYGEIDKNGKIIIPKPVPFGSVLFQEKKCMDCFSWANCFGYVCPAASELQSLNKCPVIKKNIDILLKLLDKVDTQYHLGFLKY